VPDVAISNTGPLIAFAKINRIDLLTSLFTEIQIPRADADELTNTPQLLPGSEILKIPGFRIVDPSRPIDPLLQAELDLGEASVIDLGLQSQTADILLDERKARRLADSVYNLKIIGTGGLLLRAKKRGLIPLVKPLLQEIRSNGYFLSDRLIAGIVQSAGET
jgi:predicted nucleic acid-binding protein